MERKTSVVTPERFASGMTFDQYVAYIGTPENLKREGSGRPRSDMTANLRAGYAAARLDDAQTAAIKWLAARPNGPAKVLVISEEWSSDCRRDVPRRAAGREQGRDAEARRPRVHRAPAVALLSDLGVRGHRRDPERAAQKGRARSLRLSLRVTPSGSRRCGGRDRSAHPSRRSLSWRSRASSRPRSRGAPTGTDRDPRRRR